MISLHMTAFRVHFVAAVLVLLAVAAAAVPARGQGIDLTQLTYSDVPDSDTLPEFVGTLDSLATAVGLPPLHRAALPAPYRELRLWYGFGLIGPFGFLRVVSEEETVAGEMYHWGDPLGELPPDVAGNREWMRRHFRCFVEPTLISSRFDLCRVRFDATFDWRAVRDTLEAHRVRVLPDQEDDMIGQDGWSLIVEARDGRAYHTYEYWVPDSSRGAAERDAQAILDFTWALSSKAARAVRQIREAPVPGWCAGESLYARRMAERILEYLRSNHRIYREGWLDPERWQLVDDAACQVLREAGYAESDDYGSLAYAVEKGFLVFEIGKEGTIAESCGEVDFLRKDFVQNHGWTTLCFPRSEREK